MTESPATTQIPVQLSEPEFIAFIFPHLSMPRRGPKCKLGYHRVFNLILWVLYTGMQWKCLPVRGTGDATAAIHDTTIYMVFADGPMTARSIRPSSPACSIWRSKITSISASCMVMAPAPLPRKGGDGIGYFGHKHHKGEKVLAIVDNNGFVLAPLPVAPVNEADTVLLPDGLNTLKRTARLTGLKIDGGYLNLDGGFDSRRNCKAIFNAGLVPNVKENPRNRKTPKRGRKRLFNAAIHSLRLCVERTFAWEDKFKRLLLRFEFKQPRHYGMKLMAYTLINLRHFCAV